MFAPRTFSTFVHIINKKHSICFRERRCSTIVSNSRPKNTTLSDAVNARSCIERTWNAFYSLCRQGAAAVLRALNDERLTFPALYALRPEIAKLGLEPYLSAKNSKALSLIQMLVSETRPEPFEAGPEYLHVLKWMFLSGYKDTNLGSEYDRIIDGAAILLIKEYGDMSCLGALCDLIFMRQRAGLYTYDAEWAFFESGEPDCLSMVARRLVSQDRRDVALARRLLKFLPCCKENATDPVRQYRRIMQWISDNRPYLFYTGDGSHLCSNPCRFKVSSECKYLQKGLSDLNALSMDEYSRLEMLRALDIDTTRLLCDCSHRLYRNNKQAWIKWMNRPLPVQIETSMRIAGKRTEDGYN